MKEQALTREKYCFQSNSRKKTLKEESNKNPMRSFSDPLVKEQSEQSRSLVSSSGYSTLSVGGSRIESVKESSVSTTPTQAGPTGSNCTEQSRSDGKKHDGDNEACPLEKQPEEQILNGIGDLIPENRIACGNENITDMPRRSTSMNSIKKCEENPMLLKRRPHSTDFKSKYHPSRYLIPPKPILCGEDEALLLVSNGGTVFSTTSFDQFEEEGTNNSKVFFNIPIIIITPPTPGTSCTNFTHDKNENKNGHTSETTDKEVTSVDQLKGHTGLSAIAVTPPIPPATGLSDEKKEIKMIAERQYSPDIASADALEQNPAMDDTEPYTLLRRWRPIPALNTKAKEANVYKVASCEVDLAGPETRDLNCSNIEFSNILTEVDVAIQSSDDDREASWALYNTKKKKVTRTRKRLRKFKKKAKKALRSVLREGLVCLKEGGKALYEPCSFFTFDPVNFRV